MAIKPVLRMGSPVLASPSKQVHDFSKSILLPIIRDMLDTMKDEGGIGIAAPQIGCNMRLIMFGFDESERYPGEEAIPFTVLINPEIEILSQQITEDWEGCLSVPGMRGLVPRYDEIRYRGQDEKGQWIERSVSGFHARVVQHECDHLDGILYPERIKNLKKFGFEEELKHLIWPEDL